MPIILGPKALDTVFFLTALVVLAIVVEHLALPVRGALVMAVMWLVLEVLVVEGPVIQTRVQDLLPAQTILEAMVVLVVS